MTAAESGMNTVGLIGAGRMGMLIIGHLRRAGVESRGVHVVDSKNMASEPRKLVGLPLPGCPAP